MPMITSNQRHHDDDDMDEFHNTNNIHFGGPAGDAREFARLPLLPVLSMVVIVSPPACRPWPGAMDFTSEI